MTNATATTSRRRCHLSLAVLAGALVAAHAAAEPLWTWDELGGQRRRRGGLFALWGAEQHKVLAALRAVEQDSRANTLEGLERRVREDPADPAARDLLGRAYLERRRVSEAVAQFRAALAADARFASSRLRLAEIFLAAKRRDLAARELAQLVDIDAGATGPARRLAALHARLGEHRKAADVLRKVRDHAPDELRSHLDLARALIRSAQAADAKPVLEAARALEPKALAPRLLVADHYRAQGQWRAATSELEAAATAHPTSSARVQLGLLHLQRQDYKAARAAFQKALDDGGPEAAALSGLAVTLQGTGAYAAAADTCRRLRTRHLALSSYLLANIWLATGDAAAIRAVCAGLPGANPRLAAAYGKLLAATGGSRTTRHQLGLWLNTAGLLQRAGWHDEAVAAFEAARKVAPRSLVVGELLAAAYAAAGRSGARLRLWQQLARDNPDSRSAAAALATLYLRAGDLARATETCKSLLQRWPDDIQAHLLMADMALWRGRYAAAATHARAAFARDPKGAAPLRVLLDALLAAEKFAEAAAAIRAREKADSKFARGPLERAIAALAERKPERALKQCELAFERSSLHPRLRLLAGLILERKGDVRGAVSHFETAVLADRRYVPAQVHLGRTALRAGRPALALGAFRAAVAAAPELMAAHLGLAEALSKTGRSADAVAQLRRLARALARAGGEGWRTAQAHLARELVAAGDLQGAVAVAESVLIEKPAHDMARRIALDAYRRLDDLPSAARVVERIVAADANAQVAQGQLGVLRLIQQRYDDAATALASATETAQGATRADLLTWQAAATLAAGRTGRARTEAEMAMAARGDGTAPAVAPILVLAASGADAAAQKELARFREIGSERAAWVGSALPRLKDDRQLAGHVLGSLAARARGWLHRSVALLDAARQRAPDEPPFLYMAAVRRAEVGKRDAAVDAARALVARCPKSGAAHFLLAKLLDAQGKPRDALAAYKHAAALLPKQHADAWLTIGQELAQAGEIDGAIEAYRTALSIDPARAAACNNLAWLYARYKPGFLAEAEEIAARAVKSDPKVAAYRDTLGWIYFVRKKPQAARRELELALSLAPDNATYLYHLGMVHFELRDHDRARSLLRRALELEPTLPDAETAKATLQLLEPKAQPRKPTK